MSFQKATGLLALLQIVISAMAAFYSFLTALRVRHRSRVAPPAVPADRGGLPSALFALTRKDENRLVFDKVDIFIFLCVRNRR